MSLIMDNEMIDAPVEYRCKRIVWDRMRKREGCSTEER